MSLRTGSASGFRAWPITCSFTRPVRSDPPFQLRTIRRANPAYAYLPALREALHSQRDEARAHSTARYSYRALALNLGTSDRPESVLLDPADWERCETDLPPARDGAYILAFDMGGGVRHDGGFSAYWPATGRAETVAVIGGVPSLAERGRADNVGPLYRRMADRGELLVSEGRKTPDVEGFIEVRCSSVWGVPGVIVSADFRRTKRRTRWTRRFERGSGSGASGHVRGMGWRDGAGGCSPIPGGRLRWEGAGSEGRSYSGARWPRRG